MSSVDTSNLIPKSEDGSHTSFHQYCQTTLKTADECGDSRLLEDIWRLLGIGRYISVSRSIRRKVPEQRTPLSSFFSTPSFRIWAMSSNMTTHWPSHGLAERGRVVALLPATSTSLTFVFGLSIRFISATLIISSFVHHMAGYHCDMAVRIRNWVTTVASFADRAHSKRGL